MRTTRGVRFPVELVSCQPFDDFPPRCSGVSRTNRSTFEIRAVQQDGPMKTRGLFYHSPAFILFCCSALHRRHLPPAFQREVIKHEQNISSRRYVLCRFGPGIGSEQEGYRPVLIIQNDTETSTAPRSLWRPYPAKWTPRPSCPPITFSKQRTAWSCLSGADGTAPHH